MIFLLILDFFLLWRVDGNFPIMMLAVIPAFMLGEWLWRREQRRKRKQILETFK